jgi:endonuclease/exonuclease/phosphatase family metal-dependent hydrolase
MCSAECAGRISPRGKLLILLTSLAVGIVIAVYSLSSFVEGGGDNPTVSPRFSNSEVAPDCPAPSLRVLTLNAAHGRGDGPNQIFRGEKAIRSHLESIAAFFTREAPAVVALQEADGPSIWSGSFDHVATIAEGARFPFAVRGEHVNGLRLSYGTALLARIPLACVRSVTFAPSPPTFSKGFVVASISWPQDPAFEIDVVSVHLDFSRSRVRRNQVAEMARCLEERGRPLIVMGDFNCTMKTEETALSRLVAALDLTACVPEPPGFPTFPMTGERIDWILVSKELSFLSCRVMPDVLSDHRAVIAEVVRR